MKPAEAPVEGTW